MEKYCRTGQATDGNMAHVHCMLDIYGNKHTHTHTVCIILITFPLQQWSHESASMSRYTSVSQMKPVNILIQLCVNFEGFHLTLLRTHIVSHVPSSSIDDLSLRVLRNNVLLGLLF